MARPTKLTPERAREIITAVRGGAHREVAAQRVNIGPATLYEWLARGAGRDRRRDPTTVYMEFAEDVKKAEAEWELEQVLNIRQVAQGGQVVSRTTTRRPDGTTIIHETYTPPYWQAMAWLLERKVNERWGRRERIDVNMIDAEIERAKVLFGLSDEDAVKVKRWAVAEAEAIVKAGRGGKGNG